MLSNGGVECKEFSRPIYVYTRVIMGFNRDVRYEDFGIDVCLLVYFYPGLTFIPGRGFRLRRSPSHPIRAVLP